MTRTYGYVDCGIWDDPEFIGLSAGAQRTYFMLITQTDISACGSLALTLRRWSRTCSSDGINSWLLELSDARFVVMDEDTEELLVRTFVKYDGGHKHAKRVMAVVATAKAIKSPTLRYSVASELAKLGVSSGIEVPTDCQPIANEQATDSRRVVVNVSEYVSTTPNPQPAVHNPRPSATEPATPAIPADAPTAQTIVGEWIDYASKRPPAMVIGQGSKQIAAMLQEGIDPDDVRRGVREWIDKGLHPSALPSVVNEVMNSRPRTTTRRRNADDKVNDGLALAERLAAESHNAPRQIGARA